MKLLTYRFSRLLFFIFIFSVTGCSIFNREEDNIDVSPSPKINNQIVLIKQWTASVKGNTRIHSLLGATSYGDIIYLAARGGEVKAVSINEGSTLWKTNVSTWSFFNTTSPLLSGGISADAKHIYIGSEKAVVYALDRLSGDLVWQHDVAGEVLTKPVSNRSLVLIHTSNGFLQALNKETGALVWQTKLDVPPLSLRGQSMPVIASGLVIVGDDNGHVNAVNLKDGILVWQQRISKPSGSTEIARLDDVDASPVVVGNVIYASGYNGSLVALDLRSGQPLWHRNIGSIHNVVLANKRLYLIGQDDSIKSLNLADGNLIWQKNELKNRQLTDSVIYKDYLAVGDADGYLYLLSLKTGNFVFKTKVSGSGLLSAPIVVNNNLIIQSKDGTAHTFLLVKDN